eukprot:1704529-Rhodomonas_salina.1
MEAAQTLEALCTKCRKEQQGYQLYHIRYIENMYRKNNQNIYVVRWEGYKGTTEEPESSLAQTLGGQNAIDAFHGNRLGTYAARQRQNYGTKPLIAQ